MTDAPDTSPARTAPRALWLIAQTFLHTLFGLFGNPEDLAWSHTLTAKAYKLTQTWLRVAETLLRHLLLIEAAAFAGLAPPVSCRHATSKAAVQKQPDPNEPEAWRVSLRCFTRPPASPSARAARIKRRPLPVDTSTDLSSFFSEVRSSSARGRGESRRGGETLGPVGAFPSVGFAATCPASGGGFHSKRFFSAWPLALRFEALLRAFNDPAPYARRLARRLRDLAHRVREILRAPDDARDKIGDAEFAALKRATETASAVFNST